MEYDQVCFFMENSYRGSGQLVMGWVVGSAPEMVQKHYHAKRRAKHNRANFQNFLVTLNQGVIFLTLVTPVTLGSTWKHL